MCVGCHSDSRHLSISATTSVCGTDSFVVYTSTIEESPLFPFFSISPTIFEELRWIARLNI